jgi:uncharacterized protein YrrD
MNDDDTTNSAFQINEWGYKQAKRAYKEGFFIETIQISVNAIGSILRDLILFEVSKDTPLFDDEGNVAEMVSRDDPNDYLADLLTNQDNVLGRSFSERDIYREAKRFKIISSKLSSNLQSLYENRNAITHRLFGNVILNQRSPDLITVDGGKITVTREVRKIDLRTLKKVAHEYLGTFSEVLKNAQETASEYSHKTS